MYWDEDIDFMVGKKSAPKLGRRAGQRSSNEGDPASTLNMDTETKRKSSAPVHPRKSGGWADEGSKSAKGKHGSNLIEEERFHSQKNDSDDDVPVIPDIEELQDEIYSFQEAQAPSVSVNKATYKELDSELLHLQSNQSAFGKFTDINLNYLTNKLQSEKEVQDPDIVWTMEMLTEKVFNMATS